MLKLVLALLYASWGHIVQTPSACHYTLDTSSQPAVEWPAEREAEAKHRPSVNGLQLFAFFENQDKSEARIGTFPAGATLIAVWKNTSNKTIYLHKQFIDLPFLSDTSHTRSSHLFLNAASGTDSITPIMTTREQSFRRRTAEIIPLKPEQTYSTSVYLDQYPFFYRSKPTQPTHYSVFLVHINDATNFHPDGSKCKQEVIVPVWTGKLESNLVHI